MWYLSSCDRFMSLNEMSPLSVHVAACARVPTVLAPSNIPLCGVACALSLQLGLALLDTFLHVFALPQPP